MGMAGKNNITIKIFVGMIAGFILGVILRNILPGSEFIERYFTEGLFFIVGSIFISSLQMLVVPLVFVSLVCGITCKQL